LEVYILNFMKLSHISGHFAASRFLVKDHDISEIGTVVIRQKYGAYTVQSILILADEESSSGFRNVVFLKNRRRWNMYRKRILV
jgi:hypothetical protein